MSPFGSRDDGIRLSLKWKSEVCGERSVQGSFLVLPSWYFHGNCKCCCMGDFILDEARFWRGFLATRCRKNQSRKPLGHGRSDRRGCCLRGWRGLKLVIGFRTNDRAN
jgi:hypothetical protein